MIATSDACAHYRTGNELQITFTNNQVGWRLLHRLAVEKGGDGAVHAGAWPPLSTRCRRLGASRWSRGAGIDVGLPIPPSTREPIDKSLLAFGCELAARRLQASSQRIERIRRGNHLLRSSALGVRHQPRAL